MNTEYEGNRDSNEGNRDGNVDGNRKANGYKEPEFVETVDPDRITLTLEIEVRDKTAENVANDVANVATVINGYTLTESGI